MICLGIETSCDETSVAIVTRDKKILAHITYSQIDEHQVFGGVVPEIAARAHMEKIAPLIKECIKNAGLSLKDISCIAGTAGPGLIGGVIVGTMVAKALSFALDKPYIAVNHLEGHALTVRLCEEIEFPYLLLLASGGHTQILITHGVGKYEILGSTLDDAIGETFDKTAKLLGFDYPGGPVIEKLGSQGDTQRFKLPKPLYKKPGCDFSLSGLKTAVKELIEGSKVWEGQNLYDLCASFGQTICDIISDRLSNALVLTKNKYPSLKTLVVAGGVAANKPIRKNLENLASTHGLNFIAPPLSLCTDNGAMIAWAGLERFAQGLTNDLSLPPRPRWPLQELSR